MQQNYVKFTLCRVYSTGWSWNRQTDYSHHTVHLVWPFHNEVTHKCEEKKNQRVTDNNQMDCSIWNPIQALFWQQTIITKSFLSSKTFQISPYNLLRDRKHILLSPLQTASWYPIFFHPVLFQILLWTGKFQNQRTACPHARQEFGLQPLGWY